MRKSEAKRLQWRWVLQILHFRWISWLKNWVSWILILRESKSRWSKNCILDGMSLQCCQRDSARAEYLQAFQKLRHKLTVIAPLTGIIEDYSPIWTQKGNEPQLCHPWNPTIWKIFMLISSLDRLKKHWAANSPPSLKNPSSWLHQWLCCIVIDKINVIHWKHWLKYNICKTHLHCSRFRLLHTTRCLE